MESGSKKASSCGAEVHHFPPLFTQTAKPLKLKMHVCVSCILSILVLIETVSVLCLAVVISDVLLMCPFTHLWSMMLDLSVV